MPFAADVSFCLPQIRSRIGLALSTVLGVALPLGAGPMGALPVGVRPEGVGAIVQAVCLTAFESEMSHAGKVAPAGMAGFACSCVADRIMRGSGVEVARKECRLATIQRYPI
jgi:hypothetical protein